jgi:hypothetical protein
VVQQPTDRRKHIFTENERNELAKHFAKANADEFFRRISASADKQEEQELLARGKLVTEIFQKFRKRVLLGVGIVVFEVLTRVHFPWQEVIKFVLHLED